MTVEELAAYIDQSVLKPEFTQAEIRKYIQEGIDFGCRTVCINPSSLDIAAELCKGTKTKICVVCDFPFGLSTTTCKCMQAEEYCKRGDIFELDIVANYGWIRSGMWEAVEAEIRAVCDTCHKYGTAVKVIMETDALTKEEIIHATKVLTAAGADFDGINPAVFHLFHDSHMIDPFVLIPIKKDKVRDSACRYCPAIVPVPETREPPGRCRPQT